MLSAKAGSSRAATSCSANTAAGSRGSALVAHGRHNCRRPTRRCGGAAHWRRVAPSCGVSGSYGFRNSSSRGGGKRSRYTSRLDCGGSAWASARGDGRDDRPHLAHLHHPRKYVNLRFTCTLSACAGLPVGRLGRRSQLGAIRLALLCQGDPPRHHGSGPCPWPRERKRHLWERNADTALGTWPRPREIPAVKR